MESCVGRLRVAIAGAGFASRMHLPGWARVPHAEVVAICDPDAAKAEARAREFSIARVYTDTAAMLDAVRPDALDVAAPLAAHVPLCRLAAERGVHVLCQKPLAPTLAEARALADEVQGRVRLMVHENWRFRAQYRQIRRWLIAGRVGEPVSCLMQVRASGLCADSRGVRPQLLRQPSFATIDRLMIGETLIHQIDVLRWLLGPLRVVAARTRRVCPDVRGEDVATLLLEAAGCWIVVDGNFSAPGAPATPLDRLEITGTEGVVLFGGSVAQLAGRHEERVEFDLDAGYADSYAAAIAHFAQALASGAPFETDICDNLETLAIVESAYEKAQSAR